MSTGRLNPSTNRVRTSVALNQSSIWTNTIGLEEHPEKGSNAAVEAVINAPSYTNKRAARQAAAAEAVAQTGAFDTQVTDYESLLSIARSQGVGGAGNRGACRVCGQLGHLTKQCRNMLSAHFKPADAAKPGGAAAAMLVGDEGGDEGDLSSGLSDLLDRDSDGGSSSSGGSSGSERKKRKRKPSKEKSSKEKSSKDKKKSKKERKEKKRHKDKKERRHKKQRRSKD